MNPPSEPRHAPIDLTQCEREPIHVPGSIQPHGFLIAFDGSNRVQYASGNVGEYIGHDARSLMGRTIPEVFDAAFASALETAAQDPRFAQRPIFVAHLPAAKSQLLTLVAHRCAGRIIVEGEAHHGEAAGRSGPQHELDAFLARMETATSVPTLLEIAAQETRRLTGFDRVMVYQFDPDWNGVVVAEDRNYNLPSYLDLRFPASDIPRQARDLYTINRLRLIARADYQPVPILAREDVTEPLDLTLSSLRSVSPVHLEYMRNMGTGSSMSISLLRAGRLWGLISCHNRAPATVSFEVRGTCELLAQVLSLQLAMREETARLTYRMQLNSVLGRLVGAMSRQQDVAAGLCGQGADLLEVTGSSGAAVVFQDRVELVGRTPEKSEVLALAEWLQDHAAEVAAFDRLPETYAPARAFAGHASGLLAISVSRVHPNFILWFRPEVMTTVRWGGNPAKPAEAEAREPTRLHPRKSFEAWAEIVRGRSAPWQPAEVDVARELRSSIIETVLHNAERFAEVTERLSRTSKELETISYTISHDLRAPLRAMYGYADALLQDAAPRLVPEDVHRLERISRAAHRLDRMIRDVLRYSHVSRMEIERGAVQLDQLVRNVIATEPALDTHRDAITIVEPLPTLVSSPELLKESFAALLSNALKFVPPGRTPQVKVRAEEQPDRVRLWCEDNGSGIMPEFQDRAFSMFERIHPGQDHEGNGVGLAIVKRAVNRLGGEVGVHSTPGQGSRYWIDLPRS